MLFFAEWYLCGIVYPCNPKWYCDLSTERFSDTRNSLKRAEISLANVLTMVHWSSGRRTALYLTSVSSGHVFLNGHVTCMWSKVLSVCACCMLTAAISIRAMLYAMRFAQRQGVHQYVSCSEADWLGLTPHQRQPLQIPNTDIIVTHCYTLAPSGGYMHWFVSGVT